MGKGWTERDPLNTEERIKVLALQTISIVEAKIKVYCNVLHKTLFTQRPSAVMQRIRIEAGLDVGPSLLSLVALSDARFRLVLCEWANARVVSRDKRLVRLNDSTRKQLLSSCAHASMDLAQ